MNLTKIVTAICSLLFLMIGTDKFLNFLEPPCSMMDSISSTIWNVFGVMQLAAGVLIWLPKWRRPLAGFFTVFMLVFTIVHLVNGTNDFGGAASMAVLLALLAWNPDFMNGKKQLG